MRLRKLRNTRCPECKGNNVYVRVTKKKRFRCRQCGFEFGERW